jgi:hypothetical protein
MKRISLSYRTRRAEAEAEKRKHIVRNRLSAQNTGTEKNNIFKIVKIRYSFWKKTRNLGYC